MYQCPNTKCKYANYIRQGVNFCPMPHATCLKLLAQECERLNSLPHFTLEQAKDFAKYRKILDSW